MFEKLQLFQTELPEFQTKNLEKTNELKIEQTTTKNKTETKTAQGRAASQG